MSALSITAGSVKKGTGATTETWPAGETITAGQGTYLHTDGKLYKTDTNDTAAKAELKGIALNGGAVDQPIQVQLGGEITIGATVAVGIWYVLGPTPGEIIPTGDAAQDNFQTLVGYGKTAAILVLFFKTTNIQKA